MFDATRIAELGGIAIEDYIYGLHSDIVVKPHDMTFEKSTRYLYDLLASGTASSDSVTNYGAISWAKQFRQNNLRLPKSR